MAAFGMDDALSLTGDHEPERVTAVPVSANLFEVLGVNPILGRTFRVEEETPGRDQVIILGHGLWQRRFGSDPNLVGKTILLDGRSYLVVGIMPPGFVFPGMTDSVAEYEALRKLIKETGLKMIQWRNFNIDPDWYLGKIGVTDTGECLGVKQLMELIREEFPDLKFGYFNPSIERIKGNFEMDFAH